MPASVMLVRVFVSAVAAVLVVFSAMAWRRRRLAPEARIVALLLAACAIYCFGYAQEVAQTRVERAFFWLHIEYLGIPWIPALWVLLARKHRGLRSRWDVVLAVPIVVLIFQLTNSLHFLYDRAVWMTFRDPFWVVSVVRGPIAWLNLTYLFSALPYGAWVILSDWAQSTRRVRKQKLILAGSGLFPFFGYFVYFIGISPWGIDAAPVMLGASAVLAHIAIFHFQILDVVPMARSLVFSAMREAVLVTDMHYRLMDFNPVAARLLPRLASARPGDDISVLSDLPAPADIFRETPAPREIDLRVGGVMQYFELRVYPLRIEDQQYGWTAILANVTAQRRLLEDLRHDAETDELTAVANRRSFLAAAEREIARSDRYQTPFTVMIVDLDDFKVINDHFGHSAGDKVLCNLADRILECLRTSDFLSRFGGDEFAILLPETWDDAALEVAERIRDVAANSAVEHEGNTITTRISIGLTTHDASSPADLKQLLERADRALYDAKAQGRNRVSQWRRSLSEK